MLTDTIKAFKEYQKKMAAYHYAAGVMYVDGTTAAPASSYKARGAALKELSGISYQLSVSQELRDMLKELMEHKDELDFVTMREAEEMTESLERMSKIPQEEFVAYSVLTSESEHIWAKAKNTNDYAAFRPYLEKIIETKRRFSGYTDPGVPVMDALLDHYEKGLNTKILDEYFANVKEKLVPIILAIGKKGQKPEYPFMNAYYPIEKQREFSQFLMDVLTIDKERCQMAETEHPYTSGLNLDDVRLTTHFYEDSFTNNMFTMIHEGGHAIYELGSDRSLADSSLAGGAAMSIHESQSRFFENMIGRSKEFCEFVFPKLCELFPEQLSGYTANDLYLAVNRAEPSLIRIEADELTYSLHIMVRYELEKQLIEGSLSTYDLPEAWNAKMKEYLGVDVPDDAHGVLQDVHWGGGMIGYFPSYSLGSAYAAQMYACMEKDIDVSSSVRKGDLKPSVDWLGERIHKHGQLYKPGEIIEKACGGEFDPKFYCDYLAKKYSEIYEL